ncbi:MAG: phage minor head protein, partial [Geminicoccaceae bacterium]
MATANENIRDALIKRQITIIQRGDAAARETRRVLEEAHKDLMKRIDRRLRNIVNRGEDTGPRGTARLLALEKSIRSILGKAHRRLDRKTRKVLREITLEDPREVGRLIKDQLPVTVTTTVPSARQLRGIVDDAPVDGKPFRRAVGDLEATSITSIIDNVRRGLALGEGIQAMTSRIRKGLELTRARVVTIVRAAANGMANRARQLFFEENAEMFKKVVWIATLDDRKCPFCGALDGKRFDVDKGPRPPAHSNCRCTHSGAIDGELVGERPLKRSTEEDLLAEFTEEQGIKKVKRRASLPRGFKGRFDQFSRRRVRQQTGRVPASETFDEFLRKQSPAFQNKVLREQVAEWYR